MKRETLRHPKTYDLASRLNCSRPEALGYLTLLWDHVTEVAPRGDIGKWPDGSIAGACDYRGNAEAFVDALVDAGWLERNEQHRLIVHDWPDHCERWVKAKLLKLKLEFLKCYSRSTDATTEATADAPIDASPPRDRTEPNQPEPNPLPLPPPQSPPVSSLPPDEWGAVEEELWKAGLRSAREVCAVAKRNRCTPLHVRGVLEHWRSRAPGWGLGALGRRIEHAWPGEPVDSNWPDASKEAAIANSRDKSLEKQQILEHNKKKEAEKADRERKKLEALERKYGAYIDSWDAKTVRSKTGELCGKSAAMLLREWGNTGHPRKLHRESLLLELEAIGFEVGREAVSA